MSSRGETSVLRQILLFVAETLIIFYVALDSFIIPIFRPLLSFLARLRVVKRIESLIGLLPAYVILVILGALFFVADPAKVYGLFLFGTGHFVSGFLIFISAYLVSLALVERVFRAGEAKLRTIGWFAKLLDWLFLFRDKFLLWVKSTNIWKFSLEIKAKASELFYRFRLKTIKRVP